MQPGVAGINVAYFENLSITTMIVPRPSDFGKEVMKFMVTLSHRNFASGSDLVTLPVAFGPPCLVDIQNKSAYSTTLDVVPHAWQKIKSLD